MALLLAIVLAAAHLEDADLVVPPVGEHRRRNRRPRHQRRADRKLVACADRQHLVDRDFSSDVRRHLFYPDLVAGRNLVLLAAGFYHRVHGNLSICVLRTLVPRTENPKLSDNLRRPSKPAADDYNRRFLWSP